jgi:hypothetical protein
VRSRLVETTAVAEPAWCGATHDAQCEGLRARLRRTHGQAALDGPRLDELVQTAARLNLWEFLLVIAPPSVPGSTGELVNPLAMF